MSKISFTQSLIDVVEYVIKDKLSNTSIDLLYNYYNQTKAKSIKLKAKETIERYMQENLLSLPDKKEKLNELIQKMYKEADLLEKQIINRKKKPTKE